MTHTLSPPPGRILPAARVLPAIGVGISFLVALKILLLLDRDLMAQLKPAIDASLGIHNQGYSLLVSSFLAPYIATYCFVGRWIDRLGHRRSIVCFGVLLAAAAVVSALADSVWEMAAARALLGVAEAGLFSAVFVAINEWFSTDRKALVAGIVTAGGSIGGFISPLFAASAVERLDWRWAILLPGLVTLPLLLFLPRRAVASATPPGALPRRSLKELLADKPLRTLFIIRMITDPFSYMLQFWAASYFQETLGLGLSGSARLLWLPPIFQGLGGVASGYISDRMIRSGVDPARARAWTMAGLVLFAPCFVGLAFSREPAFALVMLIGAQICMHCWLSATAMLASELTPRHEMGSVVSLLSAAGGITGALVSLLTGSVVDRVGFAPLFCLVAVALAGSGFLVWTAFLKRPSKQPDKAPAKPTVPAVVVA